jgi:hypothetical protein
VLVGSAVAAVLILAGYWTYHWSRFQPAQQSVPGTAKGTASVRQPAPTSTTEPGASAQQAGSRDIPTPSAPQPDGNTKSAALPKSVGIQPQSASIPSFEIRRGMVTSGPMLHNSSVSSRGECEQQCSLSTECRVFSFYTPENHCYLYSRADYWGQNTRYDSGIRSVPK